MWGMGDATGATVAARSRDQTPPAQKMPNTANNYGKDTGHVGLGRGRALFPVQPLRLAAPRGLRTRILTENSQSPHTASRPPIPHGSNCPGTL